MKPRKTSRPTTTVGLPAVPQPAKALKDTWRTANQAPRSRKSDCGLGGLIPPHEMFGRVLPGPRSVDVNMPFEERVERAWGHIKATRFMPEEYERLREVIMARIEGERRSDAGTN